ncbi:MAG: UDP-N-acetylglucosamine 2-epimerase (non-hydrolyzing) [Polyangiales bacterium]
MIAFVLGTRPELIKTAPVIHELARRGAPFVIIHTGQHYTPSLDEIFFKELELPAPASLLKVGSLAPAHQVAAIIGGVADALAQHKPRVVMVQGDTNSVLGGAIAAHKLGIAVAHLEAGLRSDDWNMPEEGNRILAGRVASFHFCPTEVQAQRLLAEGITRGVHVVGNTIVDASLHFAARAQTDSRVIDRLALASRGFALLTMHRPSNVDEASRLQTLLHALAEVAVARGVRLVFPVHPRTEGRLRAFGLSALVSTDPFVRTDPLGYLDMLRLLTDAAFVLTDSGGVQEEACILHVPCVTLRSNTERPETLTVGANVLCDGIDARAIEGAVATMLARPRTWATPFGDGKTASRVADIMLDPGARLAPSGALDL